MWLIRILLSIHLIYQYGSFFAIPEEQKWGTFLEIWTEPLQFLPYSTFSNQHTSIQQLLFKWCMTVSLSWSDMRYLPELCTLSTENNKDFRISLGWNHSRSDGNLITLDDIYFTYNWIIKENNRSLPQLDGYKNINITAQPDHIMVQFPFASIDNRSFFTQGILPAHIVSKFSHAEYLQLFSQNPIVSGCGALQTSNDKNSSIIDVSSCLQNRFKNYQYKQFTDTASLEQFVQQNRSNIQLYQHQTSINWFINKKIISRDFLTVFFNEQKSLLSRNSRSQLLHRFDEILDKQDFLLKDRYLFQREDILMSMETLKSTLIKDQVVPRFVATDLPASIQFDQYYHQVYRIGQEITDTININFWFSWSYDTITVSHNQSDEIKINPYNTEQKQWAYKLSPVLRNITPWYNTYVLRWYKDNQPLDTYEIHIYYGPYSWSSIQAQYIHQYGSWDEIISSELILPTDISTDSILPIRVLYFNEWAQSEFVELLKIQLAEAGLSDFFRFEAIIDPNVYQARLQIKDYDIVITTLNLGIRRDISNIFVSDLPSINPSTYTNLGLANEISKYFLVEWQVKIDTLEQIQSIYLDTIPMWFLGKIQYNILVSPDMSALSEHLPYVGRRNTLWANTSKHIKSSNIDRTLALSKTWRWLYIEHLLWTTKN